MQQSSPVVKDLVLIGGGHTHVIALRMFGMKPMPGVRLTLITEATYTPYSGMLPGHVAGLYNFEQCHIDLRPLAHFAQAQLLIDRALALDLENNRVVCANHPDIGFDLLSIDIGSIPATHSVPGASEHSIPAKPVADFLMKWQQLVDQVAQAPDQPLRLGIVGGGAGGVELSLAMQYRLHQILNAAKQPVTNLELHLFHRSSDLIPSHNRYVSRHFHDVLLQRSIQLHLNETVSKVQPQRVICESGLNVNCDSIFWVTWASAPDWPQAAGLATDAKGFIQVNDTLQSSHPQVFAAGDIATMIHHPRPKAGVFAVRQGKPLFFNLRRALQGKPLKPYKPQQRFLSLISTGNPSAVAAWGPFGWHSPLLWHWKDHIDRKFMDRFRNLPQMSDEHPQGWGRLRLASQGPSGNLPEGLTDPKTMQEFSTIMMRCGGCGSKVGSSVLERVLRRINQEQPGDADQDNILIGLDDPDDAAVVRVPPGQVMVHSLDYFRTLINDPFIFGQICAHHSLSDIYAMGATPQSALAIATIPYALEAKQEETLYQVLSGATKVLRQARAPLIGGHTTEGAELVFGLSCNGLADSNQLLRKGGMQPGHVLILTKALGTGTLLAADMRLKAKGYWIDRAIQSMLQSNAAAAACLLQHQATACTDITGFGLLGHLVEMIAASHVAIELDLNAVPILDGALVTVQEVVSSLQPQNLRACYHIDNLSEYQDRSTFPLLFDPQTSGGLLAAIPEEQANLCLASLKNLGYLNSSLIGRVITSADATKPIMLMG